MQKWEYLRFVVYPDTINCSQMRVNDIADTVRRSFPKAKLELDKNRSIKITNVWYMDLIDFLGSEGWELTTSPNTGDWLFKRPYF